ncbi:MAG TPA: hypothetical protein PK953_11775 [Smithellaceae bacterium]|nr:MAG: hypothetical protein BWX70_02931 [Verrucomicrobia bacterium ADurb.Bin070]HOE31623.1 hypothetical protein [Planctomycetota bacterium]HQC11581.1 hypothetical protein [Smithellaceae bacterium]
MAMSAPERSAAKHRRRQREAYWRGIFAEQKTSGLTHAAFCRRHLISRAQYYWWKREIATRSNAVGMGRREQGGSVERTALTRSLVPVRVVQSVGAESSAAVPVGAVYEIVLTNQRRLRLSEGFDEVSVARLVAVLD